MNDLEHRAPRSHRAYIWSGLGAGLLAGVLGMVSRGFAFLELLNLVGGGVAGAVVGSVLFRTRSWRRDDYAVQALRVPIALLIASLILSDLARLTELQTAEEARVWLAVAPGAALGFGWTVWARHFNERRLPLTRRDVGVLLSAAALAVLWAALVSRFAPTGAA